MSKKFWFVAKPHKTKEYYVAGIDPNKKAIIWTHKQMDALKFENLAAARQYIQGHLNKRTDVHVVSAII